MNPYFPPQKKGHSLRVMIAGDESDAQQLISPKLERACPFSQFIDR